MKIVAIDAGYRNFAWISLVAGDWRHPLQWRKEDICPDASTPSVDALLGATVKWCDDNQPMLDDADAIVFERQIHRKYMVINAAIRSRWFGKTSEYSPSTVGKFFGLPGDRASKKKAAVNLVSRNLELPRMYKKKDDLADAMLLAIYHASIHSQVEGWRNVLSDEAKQTRSRDLPGPQLRGKRPAASAGTIGASSSPARKPRTAKVEDEGQADADGYRILRDGRGRITLDLVDVSEISE